MHGAKQNVDQMQIGRSRDGEAFDQNVKYNKSKESLNKVKRIDI